MSELSSTSGVSIPTIKFYLREGLLPSGRRTRSNQAFYTQEHLTRLKLIGVMSGIARLSLAEIKGVLAELDGPGTVLDTMAAMQNVLVGRQSGAAGAHLEASREILDGIIADRGWQVRRDSPAYHCAARTIAELHTTDLTWTPGMLGEYAEQAATIAELDVQTLDLQGVPDDLLVQIVQGTLLRRQLVDSLVLLGQQHIARGRFSASGEAAAETGAQTGAEAAAGH